MAKKLMAREYLTAKGSCVCVRPAARKAIVGKQPAIPALDEHPACHWTVEVGTFD